MALKLTVILLLMLYAVMQFTGTDTTGSPFAETPGAPPEKVILAVAPLDTPAPVLATAREDGPVTAQVTRPTSALAELPTSDTAASQPEPTAGLEQVDSQSPLDLVVLDPSAALNSIRLAPRDDDPTPRVQGLETLPSSAIAALTDTPEEDPQVAAQLAEVTGSTVNLRSGPSTSNAVLGRARVGDVVEWVSDPEPGWALIKHPDLEDEVYMSSQFLRRLPN